MTIRVIVLSAVFAFAAGVVMAADQASGDGSAAIMAGTCNKCHEKKKPLTPSLLKSKDLGKLSGHMQKKGKLTDAQLTALIHYLEALRDGKAAK